MLLPIELNAVGVSRYGVWIYLTAISNYLYYADLGIGTAILHFGSRARGGDGSQNLDSLLANGLAWIAVVAVLITPVYGLVADSYLHGHAARAGISHGQAEILLVFGCTLVAGIALRPFQSALVGAGDLALAQKNQLVGAAVKAIAVITACTAAPSIVSIAAAESLALVVPSVLALVFVRRRNIASPHLAMVSKSALHTMLSYSFRTFMVDALSAALVQSTVVVVGNIGSSSSVTYFGAALRIYNGLAQMMNWVTSPIRPALSRLRVNAARAASDLFEELLTACLALCALVSGVALFSATDFVRLWVGSNVPVALVATVTRLLVVALLLSSVHMALITAGDAFGRPGAYLWLQASWLAGFLVIALIFGRSDGLRAVGAAFLAPLVILEPVALVQARTTLGIALRDTWRRAFKPVLLASAAGAALGAACLVALERAGLPFAGFLSALAYGVGYFLVASSRSGRARVRHLRSALSAEV